MNFHAALPGDWSESGNDKLKLGNFPSVRCIMIAAFDVHYASERANAAAVVFEDWDSDRPTNRYSVLVEDCEDYAPGHFYLRELKPLLAVVSAITEDVSTFVIDGYCHLSDDQRPGLGAHLANQLPDDSIIIGVAKNRFRDSQHAAQVLRGTSERPLFVTAIGMDYQQAADLIDSMHGPYRIPTLLKEVDRLSRSSNDTNGSPEE